jgi:hypothetical protein
LTHALRTTAQVSGAVGVALTALSPYAVPREAHVSLLVIPKASAVLICPAAHPSAALPVVLYAPSAVTEALYTVNITLAGEPTPRVATQAHERLATTITT